MKKMLFNRKEKLPHVKTKSKANQKLIKKDKNLSKDQK